ncbi:MAG: nuclear transport factor 2 family protein [Flavobacteriaceae bacterium]|nr:nuclear transport factor 2 family protein [Flavobacteriaceae bacterium]
MNIKEMAQVYLEALRESNLEGVVNLFSEAGEVLSPIYGRKPAREFYEILFKDTRESIVTLKGVFQELDNPRCFTIYFTYQWTIANGEIVNFEVVDIIELDENNKIKSLTIIYDTKESRPAIDELNA